MTKCLNYIRSLYGTMRVNPAIPRVVLSFFIVGVYVHTLLPHQPLAAKIAGWILLLLLAPFLANVHLFGRRFRR